MQTRHIKVDPISPEADAINQAASIIKAGGLVAFPTETVYGLGASAYAATAVQKIFVAKNRPVSTPLLVHVCNIDQVQELVTGLSQVTSLLMQKFWPGPLSLILPAHARIPAVVTAGSSLVGVRMPSHPVALALIACTGPLAAPSANLSGRPSPVTPAHVIADLEGRIECLLDAGPTGSGIESTVLDLSTYPFRVLRRGGVALEDIEAVLGEKLITDDASHRPALHNQIKTEIIVADDQKDFQQQVDKWSNCCPTGVVYYNSTMDLDLSQVVQRYDLDLTGQHGSLYTILRDAEACQLKALIFSPLPVDRGGLVAAVIDRIYEAAGKNITPPDQQKRR